MSIPLSTNSSLSTVCRAEKSTHDVLQRLVPYACLLKNISYFVIPRWVSIGWGFLPQDFCSGKCAKDGSACVSSHL